jgi:hypothetical protein
VYAQAGFKVVDRPENLMWLGPGIATVGSRTS